MSDARTRYRELPEWVKDVIQRHTDAANAARDPKAESFFIIHPRDVINTQLPFNAIAEVRREAIFEVNTLLRAEGHPPHEVLRLLTEWFGCSHSTILSALSPSRRQQRAARLRGQYHEAKAERQDVAA